MVWLAGQAGSVLGDSVPWWGHTLTASVIGLVLAALAGVVALSLAWRNSRGSKSRLTKAQNDIDTLRGCDTLTGLISRPALEGAIDRLVRTYDDGGPPLALLYIDIDNFRPINDGYGLRVGDAVLVEIAARLGRCAGGRPWASRVGGDEFVLLVQGDLPQAGMAAERVLEALQQPLQIEALDLQLSASVGIASYPEHGSRPKLMHNAALAMRSVKLGGGAAYCHFDPSMAVDLREQAELLQDLRGAVDRGQLQLVYQPKIDARSLQVTGAEALLRWQHPRRGLIGPAIFVPLAERHGLMGRMGAWVIDEACRQAAEWRERGLRMRVAVNISGHQLRQDDLVPRIEAAIARHGIRPERVTCEITESVAMEDTSHTREAFARIRRAGLHVSIDDFGTGHSSLASLRKLPAAELKIDRAFVTDLATSEQARSIAQAIVHMAHTLELRVVAEGVETEAQRDLLVAMGCDELQGFLFARPMTANALALWAADDARDDGGLAFRPSLFHPTDTVPLDA